ncbi:CapA family protein [Streptomyces sp. SID13031]|uniref:CapA family protein n=1 Tax=Streptomyces sp. SID13031 TaxID=2706046 RepID=UPI0013CDC3E5|nr:CapA family protein [Streptomyces sp. SID13031]NEA34171.1 CapA family protein [Streptomyces sp. SID13031]
MSRYWGRAVAAVLLVAGLVAVTGCIADTQAAEYQPNTSGPTSKPDKPGAAGQQKPDQLTLVATGDVLLHERLWNTAKRDGSNGEWDFAPLLAGVKPLVEQADLALCHLETPLGTPPAGYPLFQGPPQIVPALVKTGYDACSTASNHSFDQGAAGIDRTLKLLDKAGLKHTGTARTPEEAETPTIVTVQGVKVALLSYTYGFNGLPYPDGQTWRAGKLDVGKIKAMAQKARDNGAEIVVVSCHWGDEYSKTPNDQQRTVARQLLADSNIDLILGHHAHVVQPVEQLNGKWVVYGLGNLVAAHRQPASTKSEGLLMKFTFRKDGDRWKADAQYAPLLMTDTLPVRVLEVQRELAKPGSSAAKKARLELAQRRTSETVTSLGAQPKML